MSAVPIRMRAFVAIDADVLTDLLTEISVLDLLADRLTPAAAPGSAPELTVTAPIASMYRLYEHANAADERVLRVADRFERADRVR